MPKQGQPRDTVFAQRLREVRRGAGLYQKQLGIAMGLDRFVASTRINRYERGVSWPDVSVIVKLGETLGVPPAIFFTEDDRLTEAIGLFARASKRKQDEALKVLRGTRAKA